RTKPPEPLGNDKQTEREVPLDVFADAQGGRSEEAFTAGHHAFRYKNKTNKEVPVGINWQNCKCARVEICVAPESWEALTVEQLVTKSEDPSLVWTPLDKDGKEYTIPPNAIGWIRVGWNADKSGDVRFRADM